jgi:DNA-binding FrmR family transcriptional regulator
MMEEEEYCIDILTQSQAVQAQLREVDVMVLSKHLSSCVADAMSKGRKSEAVEEVVKVFRRAHS